MGTFQSKRMQDPIPGDTRDFIVNLLQSAGGVRIREGVLNAAVSEQVEVFHGADSKPTFYNVNDMRNNALYKANLEMPRNHAEALYQVFHNNFMRVLERFDKEGRPATFQTYREAFQRAAGNQIDNIGEERQNIEDYIKRLEIDKGSQKEIDELRAQMERQERDFDEKMKKNEADTKHKKDNQKGEPEPGTQMQASSEGLGALLKQANRYDIKTIAWMGIFGVMGIPFDLLLSFIKATVKVQPTSGVELLEVLGMFGSLFMKTMDDKFGFGPSESPKSRKGDGEKQHEQAHLGANAAPKPKPTG